MAAVMQMMPENIPPEILAEIEAQLEQQQQAHKAALEMAGVTFEKEKDEAVRWKRPIEARMLDDLRQIHGETPDLAVKDQSAVPYGRSRESVADYRKTLDNITRPAVVQISARLGDMLFPTNEKNWDMEASPFPDLANPDEMVTDPATGQPVMMGEGDQQRPATAADLAARAKDIASKRCDRMKQQIDDALQECSYAYQGRQALESACGLGTGVLKGPFVRRTRKSSYTSIQTPEGAVPELKSKTADKPAVEWVDVWNIYPQPCRAIGEAEHAFQLHLLTKKKLRELAKQPGFDAEAINELLGMEPDTGALGEDGALVERERLLSPSLETITGRYTVWERHGPIPRDVLKAMGYQYSDDDHLSSVSGCVWFCQGKIIKATPALDEDYDELPYRFFVYEKDPTCCFGLSVPTIMRHDQAAVNQTWHMLMLNGMMSAGPQIGVVPGMMAPVNGKTDLTCFGPKVWTMKDEVMDIKQVLSVFELPNYTQQLMPLYEAARRNAADHTMLPSFFEGKASESTQTASGLAMLMNSSNIVQRRAAKAWDDQITIPLIGAFNRYFLLNGDDEESKGDFDVVPKGESYLLVKDSQAQHIQVLIQLAENPKFSPYFKPYDLLKLFVKTLNITTSGLMRDEQEVEAEQAQSQQQQQQNPDVMKAEAAMKAAEASVTRAQSETENAVRDDEFRRWEREMQHMETMAEIARKEAADYSQMAIAQMQLEQAYASAAAKQGVDMERLANTLRIAEGRRSLEEFKAGMNARLKAHEMAQRDAKVRTELAVEAPNVRLA